MASVRLPDRLGGGAIGIALAVGVVEHLGEFPDLAAATTQRVLLLLVLDTAQALPVDESLHGGRTGNGPRGGRARAYARVPENEIFLSRELPPYTGSAGRSKRVCPHFGHDGIVPVPRNSMRSPQASQASVPGPVTSPVS